MHILDNQKKGKKCCLISSIIIIIIDRWIHTKYGFSLTWQKKTYATLKCYEYELKNFFLVFFWKIETTLQYNIAKQTYGVNNNNNKNYRYSIIIIKGKLNHNINEMKEFLFFKSKKKKKNCEGTQTISDHLQLHGKFKSSWIKKNFFLVN